MKITALEQTPAEATRLFTKVSEYNQEIPQ